MAKKNKYNRRRALVCKLVRQSKKNRGYFRYDVTIGERDGKITRVPAYGKDMQDALSRLLNKERTTKLERRVEKYPSIFFILWLVVMSLPVIINHDLTYTPWFILYMFGAFAGMFLIAGWWHNYLSKGDE